MIILGDRS